MKSASKPLAGVILLLLAIGSAGLYTWFLAREQGNDFWKGDYAQATVGGVVATIAGVVLGLPVALWVNEWGEKKQSAAAASAERDRAKASRDRVAGILEAELTECAADLKPVAKGTVSRVQFQAARWSAISSSGDLQWFEDIGTTSSLAVAYESVATVNLLGAEWLRVLSSPDTASRNTLQKLLVGAAADALDHIESARKALAKETAHGERLSINDRRDP